MLSTLRNTTEENDTLCNTHEEEQYLELIRKIIANGTMENGRNGIKPTYLVL